jgi:NAD(P)-dependent dehydrogenase (short-subunit alcohol dehydrogenase family)
MAASLPEVAIVTGVSVDGLGLAVARALAAAGMSLLISDHPRKAEALEGLVGKLSPLGKVVGEPADVTSEADAERLADRAVSEYGKVDVLVNNAGVMLRKDVFATTVAEWEHVIATNLTGTWLTNRAVGRRLCEQRGGAIVNMSSVYADRVGPLPESAYYSSKAAIANLTRAMAGEFGPYGVTVNCVAPGLFFPTAMTRPLADDPATLAAMQMRTMLGRLGDPQRDIHGVVAFLVSDAARYITGQTLYVDGGWSAW